MAKDLIEGKLDKLKQINSMKGKLIIEIFVLYCLTILINFMMEMRELIRYYFSVMSVRCYTS